MICLIAAFVAGQINRGIYRLAWNRRSIGPWSPPAEGTLPRSWFDRVPILGWIGMSRESPVHGAGYWHRPFLIEIAFVMGVGFLYVFELNRGIYPLGAAAVNASTIHYQFIAHFVLIAFMTVATFIDIDEKTIPDEITIPGTLTGFLWATIFPASLLPVWNAFPVAPPILTSTMTLASPNAWPVELNGPLGLAVGVFCVSAWIYALLPKTLWYRGGIVRFWKYLFASIVRHSTTKWFMLGLVILIGYVTGVWTIGGPRWQSLLTSLVGMAGGGATVWIIRVIARPILGQEAMGFGDVTLLAMIGAFVGWQASVVIFFVAPFTGSVIALSQYVLYRKRDIPFGPFLSSAALVAIIVWPKIWTNCDGVLRLGIIVPISFGVGLLMLAVSLGIVRAVKSLFSAPDK
jgi:prepilin signal peptidase PulO-like enzyme (type II secretory pathway)